MPTTATQHWFATKLTNASVGDSNSTIAAKVPALPYKLAMWGMSSLGWMILGLNVFVLVCLARHRGQIGTGAMKAQLMSITLSDILTSLSMVTFGLVNTEFFSCNRIPCVVLTLFFYVVQTASILTMALIGGQRLFTVWNIKKKQSNLTNRGTRVVKVTVPVIWTLCLLLYAGLYAVYGERDTVIPTCQCVPKEAFGENHKSFINKVLYINMASLLVVNGIYFTIFFKLRSIYPSPAQRKRNCCMSFSNPENGGNCNDLPKKCSTQKTNDEIKTGDPGSKQDTNINSVTSTVPVPSSESSRIKSDTSSEKRDEPKQTTFTAVAQKSQKNNIQALVTVSLVLIALNVSTAPFIILRVVRNLASVDVPVVIATVVNACLSLNALLDPFVYCWRIKQVRQSLQKAIAALFCFWR